VCSSDLYAGNFYTAYDGLGDVVLQASVNGKAVAAAWDLHASAGAQTGAAGGSFRVPNPAGNLSFLLSPARSSVAPRPVLSGLEIFFAVDAMAPVSAIHSECHPWL